MGVREGGFLGKLGMTRVGAARQDDAWAVATRKAPAWFWVGLALVGGAWPMAWFGPAPFRHYTFFPLWLGYVLLVDGLTQWRSGSSLLARSRARFSLLFALSIPLWWLFEFANRFLGNWVYVLPRPYGAVEYALLASLSFSTVMPALFVTATFYRTLPRFRGPMRWIRIAPSRFGLALMAAAGAAMFAASLLFPRYAFPLVWLGLFVLLDPINALLGFRSLAAQAREGRWDTVVVLWLAGLTCGFFWELWNVGSMPKWIYAVPFVGRPKLFEMPLLGYGGYLPFALEVYAAYQFLVGLLFRRPGGYLTFDRPADAG